MEDKRDGIDWEQVCKDTIDSRVDDLCRSSRINSYDIGRIFGRIAQLEEENSKLRIRLESNENWLRSYDKNFEDIDRSYRDLYFRNRALLWFALGGFLMGLFGVISWIAR